MEMSEREEKNREDHLNEDNNSERKAQEKENFQEDRNLQSSQNFRDFQDSQKSRNPENTRNLRKSRKPGKSRKPRVPTRYKIIGVLLLIFVALNFIPSGYYILEPAPPMALQEIIEVEEGYREEDWGEFYLTAVGQRRATFWDLGVFFLMPARENRELTPVEATIPPDMSEVEYLEFMSRLMQDSQLEAQAAAYQEAGYQVAISSQGVEIIRVMEESRAIDILKSGDIIKEIEGERVEMPSEAQQIIRSFPAGSELNLLILRDGEENEVEVITREYDNDPDQSSLGIYITSAGLDYEMPERVSFAPGNLVGPSAGMMFALEIYNQLTEEDITGGRKIAGSGTINYRGEIGPVDGVRLKYQSAVDLGAEFFIIPADLPGDIDLLNDIEIIEVESLNELLEKLQL